MLRSFQRRGALSRNKLVTNNLFVTVFIFLIALITILLSLCKLCYFPVAGADENSYLAYAFRVFNYGLWDWPLFFSDSFNRGDAVISPFPNSLLPTVLGYKLLGVSQFSGRVISALFIYGPCLGFCLYIFLTTRELIKYLFSIAVVCLLPSILITARSIRPESEVFFLGFCSLTILFCSFSFSNKLYKVLWFFSGALAFVACCDHPLGIIFPATVFVSVFLFSKPWHQLDNLNVISRLTYWFLGMLIPLIHFLYKLNNYGFMRFIDFMDYLKSEYYPPLNQYFINYFITGHPFISIFQSIIPNKIQARLIQITYYSFLPENYSLDLPVVVRFLYHFLIWGVITLAIIYFRYLYVFKNNVKYLFINIIFLAFIISIAVVLLFNPNQVYHIYPAFFGAAFLISICFLHDGIKKLKLLHRVSQGMLYLLAIANICYLGFFLLNIYRIDNSTVLTIDKKMPILSYISQKLEPYGGRAYVGTEIWEVGTRNLGALSEIFLNNGPIGTPSIMAFQENIFDYLFYYYSHFTTEKPSSDVLFARIKPNLDNLNLNFIFFNKNVENEVYRVYGRAKNMEIITFENNLTTIYRAQKVSDLCNKIQNKNIEGALIAILTDSKQKQLAFSNEGIKFKTNSDWLNNVTISTVENLQNRGKISNCKDYKAYLLSPIEHIQMND